MLSSLCAALRRIALGTVLIISVAAANTPGVPLADGLRPVTFDGTYFSIEGKRFIPVGAHWVPAEAAMLWPLHWNPESIERDFAKMHELGFTMVRIDMLWAWFEPQTGAYNSGAFQQLDFLLALCHKYKIYLNPSLFIGGEVGEAYWDVPWRQGRHPHADPEMLRLEGNLATEFGKRYADEPAILAWDLTDEPPFWIVGDAQTTDGMAIHWTRLIANAIRSADKRHAILVGTAGQELSHGPFRADIIAPFVDLLAVHPFPQYAPDLFPDALLSARTTYGAAFELALAQGAGLPGMIHELGASTAQFSEERVATYMRAQLYSGLGTGSVGFNLWCFTDASVEQFHHAPYLRTPQETAWGMTAADGREKPLAREFRTFAKIVSRLDLAGFHPTAADAAIIVPDEWARAHGDLSGFGLSADAAIPYVSVADGEGMPGHNPPDTASANQWLIGAELATFIIARRAGLKADFPRENANWNNYPFVFLPSPLTSTGDVPLPHVHSDFYAKVKSYVEGGGYLYASLAADGAILDGSSIFGARLQDRILRTEVTLKVVSEFGGLTPGTVFHYTAPSSGVSSWGVSLEVTTGTVIAVDQDGHPALVAHTLGAGKTLLSAYPLEHYLALHSSAFDGSDSTDRIYDAFRRWTHYTPQFLGNDPNVELSGLDAGDHGYLVIVNHSDSTRHAQIFTREPLKSLLQVGADSSTAIDVRSQRWKIKVDGYDGAVFAWTR